MGAEGVREGRLQLIGVWGGSSCGQLPDTNHFQLIKIAHRVQRLPAEYANAQWPRPPVTDSSLLPPPHPPQLTRLCAYILMTLAFQLSSSPPRPDRHPTAVGGIRARGVATSLSLLLLPAAAARQNFLRRSQFLRHFMQQKFV